MRPLRICCLFHNLKDYFTLLRPQATQEALVSFFHDGSSVNSLMECWVRNLERLLSIVQAEKKISSGENSQSLDMMLRITLPAVLQVWRSTFGMGKLVNNETEELTVKKDLSLYWSRLFVTAPFACMPRRPLLYPHHINFLPFRHISSLLMWFVITNFRCSIQGA